MPTSNTVSRSGWAPAADQKKTSGRLLAFLAACMSWPSRSMRPAAPVSSTCGTKSTTHVESSPASATNSPSSSSSQPGGGRCLAQWELHADSVSSCGHKAPRFTPSGAS
eukprot:CAMPEP_0185154838 /NCGR_PEP_ID=MMETSP1139-20130426/37_1 /TAXON_ID=298111 /ORGANISM="Pavlova sp., Strain CCMP459" /LENGTH=108 /DNA_ID=CAMNT_0027719711 /DNA_START=1118 /DNA_END=1444 /DNA_ORIENTATION=+